MTQEEYNNHKQFYAPLFYANLVELIESFGLKPIRKDSKGITYEHKKTEYSVMCIDSSYVGLVAAVPNRYDVIVNQEVEQALECKSMEELIAYVRRCNAR